MSDFEPQNFEIEHSLFDILRFKKALKRLSRTKLFYRLRETQVRASLFRIFVFDVAAARNDRKVEYGPVDPLEHKGAVFHPGWNK
jgi:hypothetical protein